MKRLRYLIVGGLELACMTLDHTPTWSRTHGWAWGQYGCLLGLARRSAELDERWHTGWWRGRG